MYGEGFDRGAEGCPRCELKFMSILYSALCFTNLLLGGEAQKHPNGMIAIIALYAINAHTLSKNQELAHQLPNMPTLNA